MSNTSNQNTSIDSQIGEAWNYHFKRQNDQALAAFQKLVEQDPTHVDAIYGLALTMAALGQKAGAVENFTRVAALVNTKVDEQQVDDEDGRYAMLARMIAQQLELLGAGQ